MANINHSLLHTKWLCKYHVVFTFAKEYPQCCRQIDDDEQGGLTFEIEKGRLSFRLTAPYSEERKKAASEWAKKNGIGTL